MHSTLGFGHVLDMSVFYERVAGIRTARGPANTDGAGALSLRQDALAFDEEALFAGTGAHGFAGDTDGMAVFAWGGDRGR